MVFVLKKVFGEIFLMPRNVIITLSLIDFRMTREDKLA